MNAPRPAQASALAAEVQRWLRAESGDPELKGRIAGALDQIREFVARQKAGLERRKGRLIQTAGFKDETRTLESALENIQELLGGGKNVSRIFAAIDAFLDACREDETFDRDAVRTRLADASDEFSLRQQEVLRGTKLGALLQVLHFTPHALWRYRSVERRSFRWPAAAEVAKLLDQLRRQGIDVDAIDTVALAAMIRIRLGITPRMGYQALSGNKLAERLTDDEVIARFSSGEAPLDAGFCRAAAGILENLRRWSVQCFGDGLAPAPPEIEAEMLQIVYLAADAVRISGAERERCADFLWLLATVIAGDCAVLGDDLSRIIDTRIGQPAVRERLRGARDYLAAVAARTDEMLAARWAEARDELGALTRRSEAIAAKSAHDFGEFTELEALKEKRAEVVKSMIKASDSIELLEPPLLGALAAAGPGGPRQAGRPSAAPEAGALKDRNARIAAETKAIAAQELERLRLLIQRIAEIGRRGFADSGGGEAGPRPPAREPTARKTSDGVEIAKLPAADLAAKLSGTLRRATLSLQELKAKVESVRRRPLKGELQHAVNALCDRTRRAAEACESLEAAPGGAERTVLAADGVLPLLRDVQTAQTSVAARTGSARLTPAEKQPLTTLIYGMKQRLGEDLRDIELLRAEIAARAGGAEPERGAESEAALPATPPALEKSAGEPTAAERQAPAAAPETPGTPGASETSESPGSPENPASREEPAEPRQPAPDPARAAAVAAIAELVAEVSGALKPVKTMVVDLNATIASDPADYGRIAASAAVLGDGITTARDVTTANLMRIRAAGAGCGLQTDEYAAKFDRWQGPLASLEREQQALREALAGVVGAQEAVEGCAALEQGIVDTLRPPARGRARAEPFVPVRRRCVEALATIAETLERLAGARTALAAAQAAEWKVVKPGGRCVAALAAALVASEQALGGIRARVEETHNRFKQDRTREVGGR